MPIDRPHLEAKTYKHWTKKGVFRIVPVSIGASLHCELRFDDRVLGIYGHPSTAVYDLADAKHDDALGFSPLDAGVPASLENWNDLE